METAEGEESDDDHGPASSVLGESTHDRISPDGLMLRKQELEFFFVSGLNAWTVVCFLCMRSIW